MPAMKTAVESQLADLDELFEKVPRQHQGVLFERVLRGFQMQENTRLLERAFAELWSERNGPESTLLGQLLYPVGRDSEEDPRAESLPRTEREWEIAHLVAATIIQWLPTSVGCAFLAEAFRRAGGKLTYALPETT